MMHERFKRAVSDMDLFMEGLKSARQGIFAMFQYKEQNLMLPIVDHRAYYWIVLPLDVKVPAAEVMYADSAQDLINALKKNKSIRKYWTDQIIRRHDMKSSILQADGHTMIAIDENIDGNRFWAVFLDEKRVRPV